MRCLSTLIQYSACSTFSSRIDHRSHNNANVKFLTLNLEPQTLICSLLMLLQEYHELREGAGAPAGDDAHHNGGRGGLLEKLEVGGCATTRYVLC